MSSAYLTTLRLMASSFNTAAQLYLITALYQSLTLRPPTIFIRPVHKPTAAEMPSSISPYDIPLDAHTANPGVPREEHSWHPAPAHDLAMYAVDFDPGESTPRAPQSPQSAQPLAESWHVFNAATYAHNLASPVGLVTSPQSELGAYMVRDVPYFYTGMTGYFR